MYIHNCGVYFFISSEHTWCSPFVVSVFGERVQFGACVSPENNENNKHRNEIYGRLHNIWSLGAFIKFATNEINLIFIFMLWYLSTLKLQENNTLGFLWKLNIVCSFCVAGVVLQIFCGHIWKMKRRCAKGAFFFLYPTTARVFRCLAPKSTDKSTGAVVGAV